MVDIVAGDATGSLDLVSPRRARASGVVSGLAIGGSAATRVLVTFGDSITEGAGATPGKAMSWPAQLGRMLVADPRGRCWAVANQGIRSAERRVGKRGSGRVDLGGRRIIKKIIQMPQSKTIKLGRAVQNKKKT